MNFTPQDVNMLVLGLAVILQAINFLLILKR